MVVDDGSAVVTIPPGLPTTSSMNVDSPERAPPPPAAAGTEEQKPSYADIRSLADRNSCVLNCLQLYIVLFF